VTLGAHQPGVLERAGQVDVGTVMRLLRARRLHADRCSEGPGEPNHQRNMFHQFSSTWVKSSFSIRDLPR
jgi:hypothetical protein